MSRSALLPVLSLLAGFAWVSPLLAAPPGQADAVITLSAAKAAYGSAEGVTVHVELSNPNPAPLRVLSWLVPGPELTAPLFEVTVDGVPAPYLGMLVKRAAPTAADYLTLAGGQRIGVDVDLSRYYSFSRSGNYQISYRMQSGEAYALDSTARASGWMQSNAVAVYASGRADKRLTLPTPDVVTGPTTFTACSADRQSLLTTARIDASAYANEAATYFASGNSGARYVKWFGAYAGSRWNLAKSHFDLIRNALDTLTVDFDCNCTQSDTTYAYVFLAQPYRIHLCGAYWRAPATGTDSKAGTLIHEMSHFTELGGTNDFVYGQDRAMELAVSNPNNAVMNADNHEYFAENTPATIDGGSSIALANGVPVSGISGASDSETRFTIDVPAGARNLVVRTSGGTGDPDLYVRIGTVPTTNAYDCRSVEVGPIEECRLPTPGAGTYHIMVFGFTAYSGLTLTVSFETTSATTQTLSVTRAGAGSGTVTSAPAGINCGSTCSANFGIGAQVTLTANAASGSTFSGWSGDCSGTQRTCTTSLSAARAVTATFSPGSLGAAVDEPALVRFALPTPVPANLNCPSGFFSVVVDDGPGAGVTAGTFGMEVLLDLPGTRVLAGGLNFGGLIDVGQVGFAGFSIANDANEQQTLNLNLTGSPANSSGSLPVRVRIGRRPDANTNLTVFEANATISLASAYQTSLNLPPGFYEVTVAPTSGAAGGNAEGQFFFSLTTSFVNRPGGGFQGGAVLGGYHTVHPTGGVSGFAAFCLATPHSTSVRVLSQPSYGAAGARDLRLRIQNEQQQDVVVVPGS